MSFLCALDIAILLDLQKASLTHAQLVEMVYISGTSSQCKTRNQQQTLSALKPIEIPSNEKFNPATQES
jgi:hypothetical protein